MEWIDVTTTKPVKEALRHPRAWPGGYTLAFYTDDGARLCPACVRAEWRQVARAIRTGDSTGGWRVAFVAIYWEGPDEYCAHCNAALPSEYGDPDADKED